MKLEILQKYVIFLEISGERNARIFETEIHKKKFLDAADEIAGKDLLVYGYCVLDQKACFIIGCDEIEGINRQIMKMMDAYEKRLVQREFDTLKKWKDSWCIKIRECAAGEAWEEVMALHYLPVKEAYTIWPDHYWWTSFLEYLGRNWMHFQIPRQELKNRDIRKEHREWKRRHPEIFTRRKG